LGTRQSLKPRLAISPARCALVHGDNRHSFGALGFIRLDQDEDDIGDAAVADKVLVAVNHPLVAVEDG
jgi:hypothetical protein